MPHNKLIILARYWNDIEWLYASLEHIDYWKADLVFIAEGNWDKKFPGRSNDGTYDICKQWVEDKNNYYLIENPRDFDNYRQNQAYVSNKIMEIAKIQPGDWMLIIDCDHFYFKKDIDFFKEKMINNDFSYPIVSTLNFFYNISEYYETLDSNGSKLPYRYLKNAMWIPTNHLSVNGKMYNEIPELISYKVPFYAYHYPGIRIKKRLIDKYNIGDRKSPVDYMGGKLLKNLKSYNGDHPEFVIPVLKNQGLL
jgi:hypothetical protein